MEELMTREEMREEMMVKNPAGEPKEVHVVKAGEWDFASPPLILTSDWTLYLEEIQQTVDEGTCPLDDWRPLRIIIKGLAVTQAGEPSKKIFSLEGSNGKKSYCCYSSKFKSVLWADPDGEVYLLEVEKR